MRILVGCEYSGVVREAFRKKGHDAWSCDLLPTEIPGKHIQGDILDILNDSWEMLIVFPPCTFLTVTANRWARDEERLRQREKAIFFVKKLAASKINKICIENPVGVLSTRFRKPDQIIQPFWFGHTEPKRTCLWLQNLPKLKKTKIVEPEYVTTASGVRIPAWSHYKYIPKKIRSHVRSKTFQGIADAMADQWG